MAAGAAFYSSPSRPDRASASRVAAATVAQPAVPKKVKLTFNSDPVGRRRSAQGHQRTARRHAVRRGAPRLPEAHRLPCSKRTTSATRIESFVPAESGQMAVALCATPQPAQQPARRAPKPRWRPSRRKRQRPADIASPSRRKAAAHAMDEDGVLGPRSDGAVRASFHRDVIAPLTAAGLRLSAKDFRAFNSAEECHLHTVEAAGSIPATPTTQDLVARDGPPSRRP